MARDEAAEREPRRASTRWAGVTTELCPSRRTVLRALGGAVLLPGVLVACSSGSSDDEGPAGPTTGEASAGASVPASEVPVGQARIVDAGGERVVMAQPTEGEFVAYSSACTHQGTPVNADEGLTLTCPNHGSVFDATDGGVLNGPATSALESLTVTLEGDQLVLG